MILHLYPPPFSTLILLNKTSKITKSVWLSYDIVEL